jgi:hypothetical protein
MINLLASLILILALKWAFLFLFLPKRERCRPCMNFGARPDAVSSLVESHDGRGIAPSPGSRTSTLTASDVCS